jgi:hypothetical protein
MECNPQLAAMAKADTEVIARRAIATPVGACQVLVERADEFAGKLDFATLQPQIECVLMAECLGVGASFQDKHFWFIAARACAALDHTIFCQDGKLTARQSQFAAENICVVLTNERCSAGDPPG